MVVITGVTVIPTVVAVVIDAVSISGNTDTRANVCCAARHFYSNLLAVSGVCTKCLHREAN